MAVDPVPSVPQSDLLTTLQATLESTSLLLQLIACELPEPAQVETVRHLGERVAAVARALAQWRTPPVAELAFLTVLLPS